MAKKPKKQQFPAWWHPGGEKIKVEPHSSRSPISVVLNSDRAGLTIAKAWDMQGVWHVVWHIVHSLSEKSEGNIWMTREQLEKAFGISGSVEVDGLFARDGRHLNIPYRGSGKNGDPNISIFVTNKIMEAVLGILQVWRTEPSEESLSKA